MRSQQLTYKTSIAGFLILLFTFMAINTIYAQTTTFGLAVGDVDVDQGTITLTNLDSTPVVLEDYYLFLTDDNGNSKYVAIPDGTTIGSDGELVISYAGLIELGKDDNIQLGHFVDGNVVVIENFAVEQDPTAPTSVAISRMNVADSANAIAITTGILLITSIVLMNHRTTKQN